MFLAFRSLGCGIGYGYLHRIPTQPPSHHKKPLGVPPPSTPPPGTPPPGTLLPGPNPQDSPAPPGLETGSRQGDYVEVCGEHLPAGGRGNFMWAEGPAAGDRGDCELSSLGPVGGTLGDPPA